MKSALKALWPNVPMGAEAQALNREVAKRLTYLAVAVFAGALLTKLPEIATSVMAQEWLTGAVIQVFRLLFEVEVFVVNHGLNIWFMALMTLGWAISSLRGISFAYPLTMELLAPSGTTSPVTRAHLTEAVQLWAASDKFKQALKLGSVLFAMLSLAAIPWKLTHEIDFDYWKSTLAVGAAALATALILFEWLDVLLPRSVVERFPTKNHIANLCENFRITTWDSRLMFDERLPSLIQLMAENLGAQASLARHIDEVRGWKPRD